ncbi:MAG: HAD-IA family hydrolase [Oculatellaceae cyanobacterium Prado106]|jgi:putative hydrolase of the HAD superfamily|nr:HAD-IA family hydrolase [Oculatellaceae cyanobacterium Prado106]
MKITPENRPQVIFLDAVGTLFGVKGSVGEIYGNLARSFGVTADPQVLDRAFFQSFRQATPMAFPEVEPEEVPYCEYVWWEAIAIQTFQQARVFDHFTDFPAFFAALYQHFTTAEPWFVYPDIVKTLATWKQQGIELGVLSNFDSRLHQVLPVLGLAEFFTSVTVSTEVGAAKPDAQIFHAALAKHHCQPHQAWHIGDSQREDYEGAKAVGLKAILLKR